MCRSTSLKLGMPPRDRVNISREMSLLGAACTQILLMKSSAEVGKTISTSLELRRLNNFCLVTGLSICNQK